MLPVRSCFKNASTMYMCQECKYTRFCSVACKNAFAGIHGLECHTLGTAHVSLRIVSITLFHVAGKLSSLEYDGETAPLRVVRSRQDTCSSELKLVGFVCCRWLVRCIWEPRSALWTARTSSWLPNSAPRRVCNLVLFSCLARLPALIAAPLLYFRSQRVDAQGGSVVRGRHGSGVASRALQLGPEGRSHDGRLKTRKHHRCVLIAAWTAAGRALTLCVSRLAEKYARQPLDVCMKMMLQIQVCRIGIGVALDMAHALNLHFRSTRTPFRTATRTTSVCAPIALAMPMRTPYYRAQAWDCTRLPPTSTTRAARLASITTPRE